MSSPGVARRERFRAFPLDGALLFFQPATGRSVRVKNERTHALRRQTPRVAMFGITDEILAIWRDRQAYLEEASPRHGCAQALPLGYRRGAKREAERVALWRRLLADLRD